MLCNFAHDFFFTLQLHTNLRGNLDRRLADNNIQAYDRTERYIIVVYIVSEGILIPCYKRLRSVTTTASCVLAKGKYSKWGQRECRHL